MFAGEEKSFANFIYPVNIRGHLILRADSLEKTLILGKI